MSELESEATTTAVYDAAADVFDHPVLTFWEAAGRGTVDCLDLAPGMEVLDVAAGSGSSALAAAEIVGPGGRVVAADLSVKLLELATRKAADRGLDNVEIVVGDMIDLGYPDESFDAVVCVFGIFFLPAMAQGAAEFWRMVKPGGRLAITTFGPGVLEPLYGPFWEAVAAERPELAESRYNPWDDIDRPEQLADLFTSAGLPEPDIVTASHPTAVSSAHDWWAIVMGTGLRGTIGKLSPEAANRVRQANDQVVESMAPLLVRIDVQYAIAVKP
ncbi:MAG: class I SAM-dependent methyltransferase [Actinomycetota bacterium]